MSFYGGITLAARLQFLRFEILTMVTGEAGLVRRGGRSTSPENQNPLFRWALPPAYTKEGGEDQMDRVLGLDQTQDRVRNGANRKWMQKRGAILIPIELKTWRPDV